MPDQNHIYVNDRLFLGRVEEQKQFRAALRDTLPPRLGRNFPTSFCFTAAAALAN
ncbi:hypothetical protein MNBD_CHLOROFLEXI01-3523 [hydrothermal vent metagenome]|uniref:Uncharacterized protein n=1 Tax=hydrothermal vent metagenome TaxID=652676 RepID=A0A3B0USH5_9ZZZZ